MKIYIPHIHYTINIKDMKSFKKHKYFNPNYKACVESINKNTSDMYLTLPVKLTDGGIIGHEIIHVLQHISEKRDIDFSEQEHFAYMFSFIFGKITGLEYQ